MPVCTFYPRRVINSILKIGVPRLALTFTYKPSEILYESPTLAMLEFAFKSLQLYVQIIGHKFQLRMCFWQ